MNEEEKLHWTCKGHFAAARLKRAVLATKMRKMNLMFRYV